MLLADLVRTISEVGQVLSHLPPPNSLHDRLDIDSSLLLLSLIYSIMSMITVLNQVPGSLTGMNVNSLGKAA